MPNCKKQKTDDNTIEIDEEADKIWYKLKDKHYRMVYRMDSYEKLFVINICQNSLKYLKENRRYVDEERMFDCFTIASGFCGSIEILDFLIECFNIDIYQEFCSDQSSYDYVDCVTFAIMCNQPLNIVKHLFDKMEHPKHRVASMLSLYLHYACEKSNLDVVKFFVEKNDIGTGPDPGLSTHCNGSMSFCMAARHNPHNDVAIYLIKKITNISLDDMGIFVNKFNDQELTYIIVNFKNNYDIFNKIFRVIDDDRFKKIFVSCDKKIRLKLIDTVSPFNPLSFDSTSRLRLEIYDPYNEPWDRYVTFVDDLDMIVKYPKYINIGTIKPYSIDSNEPMNDKFLIESIDGTCSEFKRNIKRSESYPCPNFTKQTQPLFIYAGTTYYGDREVFYNSMLFLQDIVDMCDFENPIVLNSTSGNNNNHLPQYAINQYINASYTGTFDINTIDQIDIINFIKFIDQYPTTIVSVKELETPIMDYFDTNDISYDLIKDIIVRYRFKYMYLKARLQAIKNNK